jgi:hypothetical protein
MSLASNDGFDVESLGLEDIETGTSVLLTGDDADALQSVFYQLVAPTEDERSVVIATGSRGRSVQRELDRIRQGAGSRCSVLAGDGTSSGSDIQAVEDFADLTRLGMDLSTLVATAQGGSGRFRTGIFLCSAIAAEIEDTRSLYRFLNSNFLSDLRRGDGIGVCAIDTSAEIGANMNSTIAGLKTSFGAHVDVSRTGRTSGTLSVEGLEAGSRSVDVDL